MSLAAYKLIWLPRLEVNSEEPFYAGEETRVRFCQFVCSLKIKRENIRASWHPAQYTYIHAIIRPSAGKVMDILLTPPTLWQ